MTGTLKSEFRKIFSVRPTYYIAGAVFLFLLLNMFYGNGYKAEPAALKSIFIAGTITDLGNIIAIFGGLVALLLIANEYRHNTIVYTLSASNSRSKVLASKIFAVMVTVFFFTILAGAVGVMLLVAGAKLGGHSYPAQDINYLSFFAKLVFYCEGFALAGLLFGTLIRNQVGAIVALLLFPNLVEGLLSQLFKHNYVYLPFTALSQVIQAPLLSGAIPAHHDRPITNSLSVTKGASVYLIYLVAGWIITWYLFLRRDAT